jgi:hypothetical protein
MIVDTLADNPMIVDTLADNPIFLLYKIEWQ